MVPNHYGPCSVIYGWTLSQLITAEKRKHSKYAVLILNRPILQSPEFINDLWNDATVRMTIDGGTAHWDEYLNKLPANTQKCMKLPDLITGDFDSLSEEILQKYKDKGCKTVHTPEQSFTDFTKSIMELYCYCEINEIKIKHAIAIGQCSGRLDQILGNIQTLFLTMKNRLLTPNTVLYLISDDAISWLLCAGHHLIDVPEEIRRHTGAWCSLIPIGETCLSVTTSGLKWNLDNQPLQFGGTVSTSNTFDGSEHVTIKCSNTILWSMRVPSLVP